MLNLPLSWLMTSQKAAKIVIDPFTLNMHHLRARNPLLNLVLEVTLGHMVDRYTVTIQEVFLNMGLANNHIIKLTQIQTMTPR